MVEITRDEIDVLKVAESVATDTSGALVTFVGTVRQDRRARKLLRLEYDAYPEMASAKLEQVRQEVLQLWPASKVSIVHRFGSMAVGEVSVAIAVSCPHRQQAFDACEYAIDRLKEIVPIWKKEVFEDGAEWVESPAPPARA